MKPDGSTCDDGDFCTQTDSCQVIHYLLRALLIILFQSGVCVGSNQITCFAVDQCHNAGTCNPATGTCSNPEKPDFTPCDDSNSCSLSDRCVNGTCTPNSTVVCPFFNECNGVGICDPTDGTCSRPCQPCDNQITCNTPPPCFAASGTCNPSTGISVYVPLPDGSSCSDDDLCTSGDYCSAGVCIGNSTLSCAATDSCHLDGVCNPYTGLCSNPIAEDETACDDGNACTQVDVCAAGICVGLTPILCNSPSACYAPGTCNPSSGVCEYNTVLPDGTSCNDGFNCTSQDQCVGGVCFGSPVVCAAPGQCHEAGTCSPNTGDCEYPNKPDGTSCSDSDGCTDGDQCSSGTCVSGKFFQLET